MEYNKFIEKFFKEDDNSGFHEVVYARQAKMKEIRFRLKKYKLTDEEIDKLFEIITEAEIKMENVKRKFNSKKYTEDDIIKFQDKLIDIQKKMEEDFNNAVGKLLKSKYERALKIKEQLDKSNPF